MLLLYLDALYEFWNAQHVKLALDVGVHALLEGGATQEVKSHARQQHVHSSLNGQAGQVGSRAGALLAPAPLLPGPAATRLCCAALEHQ